MASAKSDIAVNELWLHDQIHNKRLSIHKIKNVFNPTDLMTKYSNKAALDQIMEFLQHRHAE